MSLPPDAANPGPRYSILIPTRNGRTYLSFAIESVLSQAEADFELVVSDNHSTDGTADYLETIKDPRFKHVRPPTSLSMVSHFEFIISEARGRWVTILGDDDGLLPFFFRRLNDMQIDKLQADAIVFRRAYYTWDGCKELQGDNVVYYSYSKKKGYRDNNLWILFCVLGFTDYMNLPQLYTTGLVKRAYLEWIVAQSRDGRFFHGDTPDAASAVVLASGRKRHYRFEEPLFWTGTSNKSVGFSQESAESKARAIDFEKLNAHDENVTKFDLPRQLKDLFDLTVIFYRALQECPTAHPFWRTKIAYYLFLGGLCLKNPNLGSTVNALDDSDLHRWKISGAKAAARVISVIYKIRSARWNKSHSKFQILSRNRNDFPTISEASLAVSRLWKQS